MYSKNGKTLIQYAIGKKGTSFIIPDIVTNIDSHAFSGCSSLTSITIPNGVTSIGSAAFSDCTSLESVTIPNSITSIGSSAFYNCKSIEKIEIPGSIIFIGNNAFEACTNLKSITFENSDGWYIFEDYWSAMDKVHGTLIDLSDSSKNVEYVTYRYADFCWYKVN